MTCALYNHHSGEYPLEKLPSGWVNAKVSFWHHDKRITTRYEIIKVDTNERYLQEPMMLIAIKCFALAGIVLHSYFLFYGILHLIRLPIATLANLSPTVFFREIWTIVRFPFYYLAMEFAALYGIFDPLNGRALFGKIEGLLHDGKNRRQAQTYLEDQIPFSNLLWKFLSEDEHATTIFIGFCMQPIGMTLDPHVLYVDFQKFLDA